MGSSQILELSLLVAHDDDTVMTGVITDGRKKMPMYSMKVGPFFNATLVK